MDVSGFASSDIAIMIGSALVGGLIIDLQRRLPSHILIRTGATLLLAGWVATLCMTASGPFPWDMGAAIGGGLFLTGIVLLLPAVQRSLRKSSVHDRRSRR